ncbi:hypothetical protein EDD11_004954 [Mortierella claussenii]|nr:hypothetical protein EDD11_004954 [Mortierella claussenii]
MCVQNLPRQEVVREAVFIAVIRLTLHGETMIQHPSGGKEQDLVLAVDLLNPSHAHEQKTHKLKRLVQSPNSYFMDVKCPGCVQITTVFSHAQTVVMCSSCANVLAQPTGGITRLTEDQTKPGHHVRYVSPIFLLVDANIEKVASLQLQHSIPATMKTSTIVAATVGVLAVATISYAVYFDSKRRNDPEFRRKLKKERKRATKLAQEEAKKLSNKSAQSVEEALAGIKDEDFPTSMEEREKFCMEQLSAGEALFTRGPENYGQAAICFYKALKVYPAPAELVMVYQKTIPQEVFTLVMGMLSKDVQSKQEKYYTVFPPKEMNVKVEEKPEGVTADGQKVMRRGLVAAKAFAVGETIYTEAPVISSLEPSLEGKDLCHYCLKEIVGAESKVPCSNCTQVIYCSQSCKVSASQEFHDILCTKDSDDVSSPERSLHEYTKATRNLVPEMLAKFLVKMVHEESLNSGAEYNSFDHMERLRYLEIPPSAEEEKEMELLKVALGSNIPGIDEFITEERYMLMKGRLLYNLYGVSTSLDANRKVEALPERQRSVRDAPITGAGFYKVSSYLMHSCEPNAKVVFSEHDHKLSIVATRAVEAGDELHVGYIKNGKQSTEQRRLELFTQYRLQCMCPLCETTD